MESSGESVAWQNAEGDCDGPVGSNARQWGTLERPVIYNLAMWGKNLVFYLVTSTVISIVAGALGASFGVVLIASFAGPAAILLAFQIMRWNDWL